MPKHKTKRYTRTEAEIERDLAAIARLYLQAVPTIRIAETLSTERPYNLSVATINKAIKVIHQRWIHSQMVDFDAAKSRELSRLDLLIEEFWEVWRRSMIESEKTQEESVKDVSKGGGDSQDKEYVYTRVKKMSEKAKRDGTVTFLKGVQDCIDMRCKILGLYAPKETTINWREEALALGIEGVASQQFESMVNEFADAVSDGKDSSEDSGGTEP